MTARLRNRSCRLLRWSLLAGRRRLPVSAPPTPAFPPSPSRPPRGGGQTYTLTLQVLALMTALTLLPAILLMMTAFTRIMIVLGILRQALGAGQTPPNQVLLGLALFLTFFVMSPVIDRINAGRLQALYRGHDRRRDRARPSGSAAEEIHAATRPARATSPPSCTSPAARATRRRRTCRSACSCRRSSPAS